MTERQSMGSSPAFTFVLTMGVVNLFSDMTYEGGGAMNGQFMGTLGASAAIISMTAGLGEFLGYALRSVSGAIAGQAPIFIGEPSLEVIAQPQIRLPILSSTSSLPLSTASTPGIFSAAEASMLLTLACAWGLRMNCA